MLLAIYIASGFAAGGIIYGVFLLRFQKSQDPNRKIDARDSRLFRIILPLLEVFAHYNQKLDVEKFDRKYRKKLITSGNPLNLVPVEFFALKQVSAIIGFFFGVFLVVTIDVKLVLPFIFAVVAFFLPNLWLIETISRRKHNIFIGLPFCMDLLILAVEAGMTFELAIGKVVEKGRKSPIRDEFEKMLQNMRLGMNKKEALVELARRTDMYEIRSFSSALIQADMLGTPLADALRTQADIRRTERFQKAEKAANEAPVKILFPLLFFIFPAVFVVLLGPIILKFMAEGM